jgi:hypothetical protein
MRVSFLSGSAASHSRMMSVTTDRHCHQSQGDDDDSLWRHGASPLVLIVSSCASCNGFSHVFARVFPSLSEICLLNPAAVLAARSSRQGTYLRSALVEVRLDSANWFSGRVSIKPANGSIAAKPISSHTREDVGRAFQYPGLFVWLPIRREQVNLPHPYQTVSPRLLRRQSSSISLLKYTGERTKRHPQNMLFFTQQQHS